MIADEKVFDQLLLNYRNGIFETLVTLYKKMDAQKIKPKRIQRTDTRGVTVLVNSPATREKSYRLQIVNYLFELNQKYHFLGFVSPGSYSRLLSEVRLTLCSLQLIDIVFSEKGC